FISICRLDNALADMIVKMIVDIFPSESAKTYYIAPIAKKDSFNNKSIPARGKLMSTWRNRQCQYKKLQLKVRLEETASDDSTEPETIEDNIKDALEWLETNQAPWNLVLEHWKKTSAHRTKALKQSTDENLVDIFETWKLYKHPSGHELIDVDFQCLNLSKVNLDKDVWFKFFYTLRQHASYSSKDETAKKLIETMKSKDVSDDSMVAMSLSLLPHLYPPRQMKRIKNKNFKPSIGLAKDSLLKFANIPGDMVRLRQETKSRAADLKLPIQPFLIIVGSIEDIQDVYVCVDNELYKVQGVLQGLDICFKTFHVFDLQYPLASQHLWILIQKGLYNNLTQETNAVPQHLNIPNELLKDKHLLEALYSNEELTIDNFQSKVFNFALCLVTQLYAYGSLNRKIIHKIIIDMCTTYINNCLDFLKCKFSNNIELNNMLDVMKNGFNTFRTEYLTFTFLKQINCFFPPQKIIIKSFLKYSKLKGDFWKMTIANQADKIIFPLVLYFDDIEINNPLGTHRIINKIGAVYCSIPILPTEYVSKLENIFLYQLHNSQDHRVNTVLGFSKSFNSSHCCRICTIPKNELKKQNKEIPEMLRTKENYFTHYSEKTFGIKENCVFHVIPNYHITQNFSVDPMHDLLEGICRYDLAKILNNLINKEKFFTLDTLNERINCFNHAFDSNVPPPLQSESIKKELIILSASEMHYLVKNLGLFVGDLIKSNNRYWQLYLIIMSSMRYEAKHKQIKETSKIISGRKNPSYSLAVKHQLQFCHRIVHNIGFSDYLSCSTPFVKIRFTSQFESFKKYLPSHNFFDYNCYSWIRMNGTRYEVSNIINYNKNYFDVSLGKIKFIIISSEKEIFFLYCKVQIVEHCFHLNAFEITETEEWGLVSHKSLLDYRVQNVHTMSDLKHYVSSNFIYDKQMIEDK
ncbi:hypothetical protein ALC57_01437, partial [Trachymyrmex cornetzi]